MTTEQRGIDRFFFLNREPRSHQLAAAAGVSGSDVLRLKLAARSAGISPAQVFREITASNRLGVPLGAVFSGLAAKYEALVRR